MSAYILALDQGTTSSRALLFSRDGRIAGCVQQEFRQIFPQSAWVEHDPNEIWQTQLAVAQCLMKEHGVSASDISAIGIANQRETVIVWNRHTGEPVYNAIVWQDRRTAALCDALKAEGKERLIQQKTGLVIDPYFSATKIKWILDCVPGMRKQALNGDLAFGTVDSWLVYKLCGEHVTDASNASRTLLFNIETLDWDDELLEVFGIPRSILPKVVTNDAIIGKTKPALFGDSIFIAGIAGDQQAATFGQTCFKPGMAKNTYGTGCFMLMNTGSQLVRSNNQLLTTIGWVTGGPIPHRAVYMLEGSAFMAGATVQWLRDGLGIIRSSSEIEALASSVPDSDGVVLVPAFAGLGAPYWDAHARGTIVGMSRGTTKAHVARAALESIAYQSSDLLNAMQADSLVTLEELRVDGGAARNDLLMQFQSDILGVPVVRPAITESTALGAAYLTGLAVSFWHSTQELEQLWHAEKRFEPSMSVSERDSRISSWHKAVERAKAWDEK